MNRDILGIDFGTTNSKIAYMLLDESVIIENSEGNKVTPLYSLFQE
jgi:molecular chaperone DnaK (HSP70)